MNFYQIINYLYYLFFAIILISLLTELVYKVSSNDTKLKVGSLIRILRKIYFIAIILLLYVSVSLLYYNGYGIISNNLYYTTITRDIFIGISLSMAYIPILYLFVRTSVFHSNVSNVFTRNKFRYVFDLVVLAGVILIFVLNSSYF